MTYPTWYRKKVLDYRTTHHLSIRQTAAHFKISPNSVLLWSKNLVPLAKKNRPPSKISNQALREDVDKYPDDFQYERADRFGVTKSAIQLAMKRLNLTRKKKHSRILKPMKSNE